jgi:hypothetical protein
VRTIAEALRREAVLAGLLVLGGVFFLYRWAVAFDLGRSSANAPYGWYGGFDQSYYLHEAHLLGHFEAIPADQFVFGPGYPVLAAPFARSDDIGWPFHDPFLPANLAVWLLTVAAIFLVGRRLYGAAVGALAALALMFASPLVRFVVVPWNTTAVLGALMVTILVGLVRTLRLWHGVILGAAVGLAYSARYIDALWIAAVALAIVVARSAAAGRLRVLLGVALGLLVVVPTLLLQWHAFGNPFLISYSQQGFGVDRFHVSNIWTHAVQFFVSPIFLTDGPVQTVVSEPLLSSMFLIVFVPIGLVQTLHAAARSRRILVAATAATCVVAVLFYLSYRDTGTSGLQFGAGHYFKPWFPLWALCATWGAVVAFRWLAERRWRAVSDRLPPQGRRAAFAAAALVVVAGAAAIIYAGSSGRLTPAGHALGGTERAQLWAAHFQLARYCTIPGEPRSTAKNAVATLVHLYRANPNAIVTPGFLAGRRLGEAVDYYTAQLRQDHCDPAEADELEHGLVAADVERGRGTGAELVVYASGWSKPSAGPDDDVRRTEAPAAELVVEGWRDHRPRLELSAEVANPADETHVQAVLGATTLGAFDLPAVSARRIAIVIPAGNGPAEIRLEVRASAPRFVPPARLVRILLRRAQGLPEPARGFVLDRGHGTARGVAAWVNSPEGRSFTDRWIQSGSFGAGQVEGLRRAARLWGLANVRASEGIALWDPRLRVVNAAA